MTRKRVISFVILLVVGSLIFQPAWASSGCPDGWTPANGWYQEGNTCKLRCAHPGQPDWWMDSGGETRPGCEALRSPAPTYFDVWGYRQAPMSDCPDGLEPEHVWFREGNTCSLECVDKTKVDLEFGIGYDRRRWLDIPLLKKQVYVDSGGESRPPWCILEN